MGKKKLSFLQISMVLLLSTGMTNHVVIIPLLLDSAGRDAWLSVVLAMLIIVVIGYFIYAISSMTRQVNLALWTQQHLGSRLSVLLSIAISIYILPMGILTLKDTAMWTSTSYLPETPQLVIVLLAMVYCGFAGYLGIRHIAICAGILLPIVVILGYFVMFANFQYKEYRLIKPILEYGMNPVWKGIPYALGGFIELLVLLILQHHAKTQFKHTHILILSLLLSGLTIGPLLGSISIFGPVEAAYQRYPAYEQWRLVKIGRFIEHVDFFSIYQWLAGSFIRISLSITIVLDLFLVSKKTRLVATLILVGLFVLLAGVLPISDIDYYSWIQSPYYHFSSIYAVVILLILFVLGLIIKRRGTSNGLHPSKPK